MLIRFENAKGIYEGQRSADPDKRVFILTRSGFAGSQRYAAAIWSGDISSRWHDMKTTDMLQDLIFPCQACLTGPWISAVLLLKEDLKNLMRKNLEEWRELNDTLVPVWRICSFVPGAWTISFPGNF